MGFILFYFISFLLFFSNYSVLAQLGFSLAWLGWAVTKIPAVSGFLPFPGSKYTQKEAPNIFTSDFMDNLVVFDLYNLAQVHSFIFIRTSKNWVSLNSS